MASISKIMASGGQKKLAANSYTIKMIHYSKLVPSDKQNREERRIEELADILELSGEIKQPLLVRKAQGDTYEVIAGHRRRLAAILNVERKGLSQFEFLPCKIENADEIDSEINLITTNLAIDALSEMEQVNAVMRLKELLPCKEGDGLKGRELRKRIAETMHLSSTKIGQLEHIGNRLIPQGKAALEKKEITVSTADALAGLPEEKQQELLRTGLKLKEVQAVAKEEKKKSLELQEERNSFGVEEIEEYLQEVQKRLDGKKRMDPVEERQQKMVVEGLKLLIEKQKIKGRKNRDEEKTN